MIDRKSFVAGLLTATAAILAVAHLRFDTVAHASATITGRDFQLVTAPAVNGGDALYILDKRTRLIGIFTWDNAQRRVVVRDIRNVDELMGAR